MSNKEIELPASLQKLYDALRADDNTASGAVSPGISVGRLHLAVYGATDVKDVRHQQQRLGSYVTKLNRRLKAHKLVVKPGALKYSYVLKSL
jgi:hypothetical protein